MKILCAIYYRFLLARFFYAFVEAPIPPLARYSFLFFSQFFLLSEKAKYPQGILLLSTHKYEPLKFAFYVIYKNEWIYHRFCDM